MPHLRTADRTITRSRSWSSSVSLAGPATLCCLLNLAALCYLSSIIISAAAGLTFVQRSSLMFSFSMSVLE